MKSMISQFEGLADREGFNASVRHIQSVIAAVDRMAGKENLADIIDELLEDKVLDKDDIRPVVSMILGQKFSYRSVSANLDSITSDLSAVSEETVKWNAVDLVAIYFHPDLGAIVVNPKNKRRMAQIDRLNRSELLVIYSGRFAKEGEVGLLDATAQAVIDLFAGRKPKVKPEFLKRRLRLQATQGIPSPPPRPNIREGPSSRRRPRPRKVRAHRGPRRRSRRKPLRSSRRSPRRPSRPNRRLNRARA